VCLQAVAQNRACVPVAQRGWPETAQQLWPNQSAHLPTALVSSHSTAPRWKLPYGSIRAKQAYPCFRTRPSSACSTTVPQNLDARLAEHRPWLEPAVAAIQSVSVRIGSQTSWRIQLYTQIPNKTKHHVLYCQLKYIDALGKYSYSL